VASDLRSLRIEDVRIPEGGAKLSAVSKPKKIGNVATAVDGRAWL
jgi:hypothetical protein